MTHRSAVLGSRGRLLSGLATVALLGAGMVQASPAALSEQDTSCPEAFPVADLVDDQPVTGLTVTRHTTPTEFTGTVLGVIHDGIAPGIDMVMADLTSAQIDKTGIWQGMSGSPVYAEDGRLIGAVAYGLAFGPSPVAGITPAADMQALLDAAPSSTTARSSLADAKGAGRVEVSSRRAASLARQTGIAAAKIDSGFKRLPMPMLVSGNRARINHAAKVLGMKGVRAFGGTTSAASADPSEIVAGGNLAATVSYGDLTSGGIGTATEVCGSDVLAFGHPMMWSGPSQLTMHGADAVYIQSDPTFPGFKVANLTAPAGSILGDHLQGLYGVTGALPDTTTVTAHVATVAGKSRDGETKISVTDAIPFISAFHLLVDEDRVFNQLGEGSARVRWTVEGVRADGSHFEYSRVNSYASRYDITFETIFESYQQLNEILRNKFEDVTITDVSYRSLIDPDYRAYRMSRVERLLDGQWVKLSRRGQLTVKRGSTLHLRAVLAPSGGGSAVNVPVDLHIPNVGRRTYGTLEVAGGGSRYSSGSAGAKSFDDLLANLANATPNNAVVGTVSIRRPGPDYRASTSHLTDQVVDGRFSTSIRVR